MKFKLIIIFCLVSTIVFSQNSEFDNNVKKMLELEGFENKWKALVHQIVSGQSWQISNHDMEMEVANRTYPKLFEKVVLIYKKHLNETDVKSIISFYETDAGKLLLSKQQLMMQETILEAGQIGQEIRNEMMQEREIDRKARIENNFTGCGKFKTGKFTYDKSDSTSIIIERNEKYQYEYNNGKTSKYRINWLNECKYSVTLIHSDNSFDEKGYTFTTNIFDTGLDHYEFIEDHGDITYERILYKIE